MKDKSNILNCSILAIDFDGVVCNGIDECMYIAYSAFHGSFPKPDDRYDENFVEYFKKNRHYVRDPREFFIIIDLFYKGIDSIYDETFRESLEILNNSSNVLDNFKHSFFSLRKKLKDQNYSYWKNLNPCYKKFVQYLLKINKPIYVVTTKDDDTVYELVKLYGIQSKITKVYAQSSLIKHKGKANILKKIAMETNCQHDKITYIDDHIRYLLDVNKIGVKAVLADWGYCHPQSKEISIENQISTISLSDIFEL